MKSELNKLIDKNRLLIKKGEIKTTALVNGCIAANNYLNYLNDSGIGKNDSTYIEIDKNAYMIEIARSQIVRIDLLKDQLEADILFFDDSLSIAKTSIENQFQSLVKVSFHLEETYKSVRDNIVKINSLLNNKDIDEKINKINSLADVLLKLNLILENKSLIPVLKSLAIGKENA